jgi:hypothetical protein
MILEIELVEGVVCFSSSDLLWVSKDVILNKGESYFEDYKRKSGEWFWWIARFNVCIFGKNPIECTYLIQKNGTRDEAAISDEYFRAVKQHEALLKALSEK